MNFSLSLLLYKSFIEIKSLYSYIDRWANPIGITPLLSFLYKKEEEEEEEEVYREKEMEEMIRDLNQIISSDSEQQQQQQPTTFTTWKLYDNPFFISSSHQQKTHHFHHHHHHLYQHNSIPVSARKIAASLWDFSFFQSIMTSQLELAKTQIRELKAEVEFERKLRKKVESLNKKLGKEVCEQRKSRESIECLCEELAKEIASDRAEISRMRREIEEERKMLRMSEVLREERVQMKFAEAKVLFEEKMLELEFVKEVEIQTLKSKFEEKRDEKRMGISRIESGNLGSFEISDLNSNGGGGGGGGGVGVRSSSSSAGSQRRASPEAENPHIKRGIKGFVEFPKVVRAIGSRGRQLGSKLECQKAQLRLLLRQKSPFRSTNVNLIMG